MNKLYSIDEVSRLLTLSKPTVYRLTSQRRIEFYKIGGRVVFDESQLERFLESHAIDSSKEVEK